MTEGPGPIVLRIKLRYDDVETMARRFAANVGKSGLFLPTKSIQPPGTEIKFELRLADGTPVIVGVGKVRAAREPDPEDPRATYGIAVALTRVTRESRDVMMRILESRREQGLPDVAIPLPEDVDAARAAVPVAVGEGAAVMSGPMSGPVTRVAEGTSSGAVLFALPPEPPRRSRPAVAEVIERASAPVALAALPALDEESVDVAAVMARARVLAAAGDIEAELAALAEDAVPVNVGIDAASAELARQLGGRAVQRWAPPPVVVVPIDRESDPVLARADRFDDDGDGGEGGDDLGIEAVVAADFVESFEHRGRVVPIDDAPSVMAGEDEEIQEIEDFEIIAEADAADADLLLADAEGEAARSDFAARLDLGDSEPFERPSASGFDEFDERTRMAPSPHGEMFDEGHAGLDDPLPRAPMRTTSGDEADLESALEALDVDLDDLSIPHASTELVRGTDPHIQRGRPAPSIRPPTQLQRPVRARTEDGVLIDFDDDEDDGRQ